MKSLVVLGLLVATVGLVAGADYQEAFKEIEEAFPGSTLGSPEVIRVVFDNGASLDMGKNITPTETKNQPVVVDWNAEEGAYYTLVVADPDGPSRKDPYLRDVLTWLVGNILGKNISSADVLAEYVSAAPPRNMGMNRYFYFIYKQPGKIRFNEKPIDKYTVDGRLNFSVQNFTKKYNLKHPVGVNFLTAYYDPQTKALYEQLDCCEELL